MSYVEQWLKDRGMFQARRTSVETKGASKVRDVHNNDLDRQFNYDRSRFIRRIRQINGVDEFVPISRKEVVKTLTITGGLAISAVAAPVGIAYASTFTPEAINFLVQYALVPLGSVAEGVLLMKHAPTIVGKVYRFLP